MGEKRHRIKDVKLLNVYSYLGEDTFYYQISLNGSLENLDRVIAIEKALDEQYKKEWRRARRRVLIIKTRLFINKLTNIWKTQKVKSQ